MPQDNGTYTLHGYKWFTSATDSDMAITLARIVDKRGNTVQVTEQIWKKFDIKMLVHSHVTCSPVLYESLISKHFLCEF